MTTGKMTKHPTSFRYPRRLFKLSPIVPGEETLAKYIRLAKSTREWGRELSLGLGGHGLNHLGCQLLRDIL
jgi:hypothetical protein